MSEAPVVTVICMTYNHHAYIEQALEGFVAQRTTFPFRVLVGDDASTDGTSDIVRDYARRYPDIIVPVIREHNMSAGRNQTDLIRRAQSPYLAFCEGDDYWTDPLKLQKQYDYLTARPALRACFHDVEVVVETSDNTWVFASDYNHTPDGRLLWPSGNRRFVRRESYRIEEYIAFGFVHTSSMFVRWDYDIEFPEWFYGKGLTDFPLWVLQVGTGEFGYLDEVMSVHRRTDTGAYAFRTREESWVRTKPGWIALEEAMIGHYREVRPAPSLVEALERRERDDLRKLVRGAMELEGLEGAWRVLDGRREVVERLYDIEVPPSFEPARAKAAVVAVAPMLRHRRVWNALRRVKHALRL